MENAGKTNMKIADMGFMTHGFQHLSIYTMELWILHKLNMGNLSRTMNQQQLLFSVVTFRFNFWS
jgi:hypothetical protein